MSSNIQMIIAMAAYMLVVLAVGFYYGNKNKTSEDYFLGGRSLGPWVTAMSAEASDMSSWLLMGLPGTAYLTGFGDAGWTAIGLILGTWLNWQFISKRLRKYTEVCKNSFTIPDFFSNRFRDDKKILMTLSAIMMVIFFTVYTASGFKACGTLFETILGLPYLPTMIICSIVIILYTSIGGFLAASTTDLIQGLLMSFAIVIVLVMGINAAGSIGTIIEHGQSLDGYFSLLNTYDPATGKAASLWCYFHGFRVLHGDSAISVCLIFWYGLWRSAAQRSLKIQIHRYDLGPYFSDRFRFNRFYRGRDLCRRTGGCRTGFR